MLKDNASWDPTWEEIFRQHDWSRYPPEELIRFIAKHYSSVSERSQIKILEIGCGTGANLWYLAREGFDAYGIDGSKTAIAKCEFRLHEDGLKANLKVGDVISLREFYSPGYFDAVIDVVCLVCNEFKAAQTILDQVLTVLKPQGRLFSKMLASGSWGDGVRREVEAGTIAKNKQGAVYGVEVNHYFTLEEVQMLFQGLSEVQIECSNRSLDQRQQWIKHWVTQAVKNP